MGKAVWPRYHEEIRWNTASTPAAGDASTTPQIFCDFVTNGALDANEEVWSLDADAILPPGAWWNYNNGLYWNTTNNRFAWDGIK